MSQSGKQERTKPQRKQRHPPDGRRKFDRLVVADQDKRRPAAGVGFGEGSLAEVIALGLAEGVVFVLPGFQMFKKTEDNVFGSVVVGIPQAHDNVGAAGVFPVFRAFSRVSNNSVDNQVVGMFFLRFRVSRFTFVGVYSTKKEQKREPQRAVGG